MCPFINPSVPMLASLSLDAINSVLFATKVGVDLVTGSTVTVRSCAALIRAYRATFLSKNKNNRKIHGHTVILVFTIFYLPADYWPSNSMRHPAAEQLPCHSSWVRLVESRKYFVEANSNESPKLTVCRLSVPRMLD
mmetsp:Transcript_21506/g.27710  ORF Transcript_21506/g.27710 Transcript_21506/m.27710 type:complete len:137 (+) Transcript_21506:1064-1474(+)